MVTAMGGGGVDARQRIETGAMHWRQMVAIALCVLLNALDGFDVLAITFALPGIARAWSVGPAELGVALSSGLVGMAAGSRGEALSKIV